MSEMELKETSERFVQGLKQAASGARELGAAQKSKNWLAIAVYLDGIREKGELVMKMKSLSRKEILDSLERYEKTIKVD